ncbi:MAG TPA: helix-turn-helix transcriptional regulator [Firmicutes bacterium]|jgi:LuxR family maltose regulon positive regulatory protein|nr:helix-turn-helix transcriptional regulator [Bacillota bacterium]
MKSHPELMADLEGIMTTNPDALRHYLEDNIIALFASPAMAQYYQLIRAAPVDDDTPVLTKLIIAWLAFLCGDNAGLSALARHIHTHELTNPHEQSFYYALLTLSDMEVDPEERRRFAALSVEVLPVGDTSLFMANAKLTYAQVSAGFEQYRTAAGLFADAYRLFYNMDMLFPSAVALANELINRYRIGQLMEVMDKCECALAMSSSFHGDTQEYWNILHLPLGMCHFELNKAGLAVRNLRLAQKAITKMGLLHMHGLIEYYLFKAYYVLNEQSKMAELVDSTEQKLGVMQGSATEILVSILRVLSADALERSVRQADVERLEVAYLRQKQHANQMLMEALAYLKVKGMSDAVGTDDLADYLHKLRYTGYIPLMPLFLLFLGEINYLENRRNDAVSCIKEATAISKEYGITVHLHTYPLSCLSLLADIDAALYTSVVAKGLIHGSLRASAEPRASLLSPKEKEILALMAMGKNNSDISKALYISVGTVKWHINHIFAKLEVRNRVEAVSKGRVLGEIS